MAKNEAKTDIELFNYLTNEKNFIKEWLPQKTENSNIQEILSNASKSEKGNKGSPDLIYLNEDKKLLILIENKDKINDHKSAKSNKPQHYAVDGIKHYLKFFLKDNIETKKETVQKYLENFRILGMAFSGNIHDENNHLITTFIIQDDTIKDISIAEFLNENDYISLFENLDLELISNNISKSSSEINRILRNIDSQKRPVLLSALMVCLYEKDNFGNVFKNSYHNYNTINIIRNIPTTINDILINEDINKSKIDILLNELAFIKTDKDLNDTDILKDILIELENNVIPLFNKQTSYDIIGKFYEEFLRYAGIANVKKGIVLTPNHITKLFTELIDIRTNDIIFDSCCGTGAFLIAGMNQLIETIQNSKLANKQVKIKNIKQNQLLGFEKSNTMYSLAISNMLFRGDGKSKIFNIDFFSDEADKILTEINPTIGFINPPYGGKDNKANPTKKEIQFLEKMLDNISRFGVIIAPLSTYFKDEIIRNRILSKHTLKYVINMPNELFAPNASTHTAIAVFETNLPHDSKEVLLYDLNDDGFVLSKNKGRTDVYNKWTNIEKDFLKTIQNPIRNNDKIKLVYKSIDENDEWILQAHMKTNYSEINKHNFILSLKKHLIFVIKQRFNLLFKDIDELSFMDILVENNITDKSFLSNSISLDDVKWQEFNFNEIFWFKRGKRLRTQDQIAGEVTYISSTKENNGIDGYITPPNNMTIYKNAITLNNSGSIGYCFYHTYNFVASDHCTIIKIKDKNIILSNYIFTFLKPIIESMRPKYGFAREISDDRLNNEIIKLPIIKKDVPHWEFMEMYIKSLPYSSNI
jgi:type I restriction enzyme M protein